MGCSTCGGTPPGFAQVWQYRAAGKPHIEFSTEAEAEAARKANGGAGHVIRLTRRK